MGNEQSGNSSNSISNSFSFFGNRNKSIKKSQIVVVKPFVEPIPSPSEDEVLIKFQEIPQFYPIFRSALNRSGLRDPPDISTKIKPKPLFELCALLQTHFTECADVICMEQDIVAKRVANVDRKVSKLLKNYNNRKKRADQLFIRLSKIDEFRSQIDRVQYSLNAALSLVSSLNQKFSVADRLPSLDLSILLNQPNISHAEPYDSTLPTSAHARPGL